MNDLFTLQNWLDFANEDNFWPTVMIISGVAIALAFFLFSDMIQQFRDEYAERAKWLHWTKQRGS